MSAKRRQHAEIRRSSKKTSISPAPDLISSTDVISPAIRFRGLALYAAIFCATLLAYSPAMSGKLIWDDDGHITRPGLQSLHGLGQIWFKLGATQQYYPILHSAFWLENRIWGSAVLGYHLTNILLHAFSACLVVLIMRRLSLPGAWLAGFVFALHPIQVESVAWISEQKSTLSGVFYLAALLVYLHFDQNRRRSAYLLASGLFLFALLSKSVTATLPVVLLTILWWQRGRLEWKRDVRPLLPWFAVGVSGGLFTAWVEKTYIGAQGTEFLLSPAQRFLIAGRVLFFYVGNLLWPANLAFFYPHWNVDPAVAWQWLFPLAALVVLLSLAFAARRYRAPLAGFLVFSATLFPVLGFFNVYPFRYSYVADHFQYLACLAIIVPACALLARAVQRIPLSKTVPVTGSVLLLLLLGALSWSQSHMYRDPETLYRTSLERNPGSWMAHYNLGTILAEKPGGLLDAIAQFQATLAIKPDCYEALNNLGLAYARIPGRLPDAVAEYQRALKLNPEYAEAHNNLGIALSRIPGRHRDAITEFNQAIRSKPDFAQAHYNLANLLSGSPAWQLDAAAEYREAIRINPDYAEAHINLGNLLARMPQKSTEAIAELRAALAINPNLPEAHNALGLVLSGMPGQLPDAIEEYRAALRARPQYAEALTNLGNALSQTPGRLQDAVNAYNEALQINPQYAQAHVDLGSALARLPGRLQDAIAEYNEALRLNPELAEAHNNLGNALALTPGGLDKAIAEYRRAISINPNFAEAHFNLGSSLARIPGQSKQAALEFQTARRIQPALAKIEVGL